MGQTIEERKGVKRNEKRKENKNQEEPNRRIRKLEKQIKELRQILAWTSNEIHRRKIERKSTKKENEILQGDSYSPVGFCLTEVYISMLIEETDGYTMGQRDKERVKRTHSLFINDLKIYQECHRKLKVVNEMIVKASMDTGAC